MNGCRWFAWAVLVGNIAATTTAAPQLLPRALIDEGWISLFDGETFFGWQKVGDAAWTIADGVVKSTGEQPGWLMTTTAWADFQLRLEFRAAAATNSGIFLRTALTPTDPTKDCYELNIAPAENPFPTGSLVGRARIESSSAQSLAVGDGQWHALEVNAQGGKIAVRIDGQPVLEYNDATPIHRGRIGLQAKAGAVAFRNLRLRPLGLKPLFNGNDLSGWSLAGAEASQAEVTAAGELRLTNGPGQIASSEQYGNFVLQLECMVQGDGLNSGIFFRTLPEGRWQGYESQINNAFLNGDRSQPADFGTGGIYRRQKARRVVPNDHEWFAMTVVAQGPHFAVWVDGYQVSDWTDTRPAKQNPREGLRLGGGVIAIQGHDATTDLLFRRLAIVELSE